MSKYTVAWCVIIKLSCYFLHLPIRLMYTLLSDSLPHSGNSYRSSLASTGLLGFLSGPFSTQVPDIELMVREQEVATHTLTAPIMILKMSHL